MGNEIKPDEFWTVTQAARYLGVSPSLIYRLVASGKLPSLKVSNLVRIHSGDLREFVRANKRGQPVKAALSREERRELKQAQAAVDRLLG